MADLAQGGYTGTHDDDLVTILGSQPPTFIPPGGMCWRNPDGSHEWIIPNPDWKPLQPYVIVP